MKDDLVYHLAASFTDNMRDYIAPRIIEASKRFGWGIDESQEVITIVMGAVNVAIKETSELCMTSFTAGVAEAREK